MGGNVLDIHGNSNSNIKYTCGSYTRTLSGRVFCFSFVCSFVLSYSIRSSIFSYSQKPRDGFGFSGIAGGVCVNGDVFGRPRVGVLHGTVKGERHTARHTLATTVVVAASVVVGFAVTLLSPVCTTQGQRCRRPFRTTCFCYDVNRYSSEI